MRILSRFLLSASDASHFPLPSLPEIAFLGRSNVGKSSVINALLGTKLARTMPFDAYNRMSSDDVNAIVDYLRTLKPLK